MLYVYVCREIVFQLLPMENQNEGCGIGVGQTVVRVIKRRPISRAQYSLMVPHSQS